MGKDKRKRKDSSSSTSSSSSSDDDEVDIDDLQTISIEEFMDLLKEQTQQLESRREDPYLKSLHPSKRKKLENLEKKIMNENIEKIPLKYKILESNTSESNKRTILEKIRFYENLAPHNSEYTKLSKYLRGIEKIPFGIKCKLPIRSLTNMEKKKIFVEKIYSSLNSNTYGQEKAKNSLLEVIAKWINNPSSKGNVIGLSGPPGIGKTSLIKNGLTKALNIPFGFIPLGGSTCSSYLQGHDYTYEGSKWGRIVEILIETQTSNPILFFDEVDKISETKNGEEIQGLLTHLTDFTQNNCFHDKYFSGIDFDLSGCLFIFSFNDKYKLNPILRDRIKIIELEGFDVKDKINIAEKYSIPKILKEIRLNETNFKLPTSTIEKIIKEYCPEKGVRKLEKCIESIFLKLNLYHMTKDFKRIGLDKELEEPYVIDETKACKILDLVFKRESDKSDKPPILMYS